MRKSRIYFYFCLLIILGILIIIHLNSANIYVEVGDYYYKKNNFEQAQKYYERAIALGNIASRENYVNSLINSPLNIVSQEKLAEFAQDNINDAASSSAEYFLYNLKREIHNKYPQNYIQQATFNQKVMHWGRLPITYSFRGINSSPDWFIEEINNAFNEWERVSSGRIKFQNVKTPVADILIDCQVNLTPREADKSEKYVVAYTIPNVSQNKLKNMQMKFSLKAPSGKDFTPNQIYNIALHEVFHALGFMGHSYDKSSIMYMSTNAYNDDERLSLTDADKMTFELLYKIKPDITNAYNMSYDYIPYLILGTNEDVNYSKIREAKNYIKKAPMLPGGYIDLAQNYVAQKNYPNAIKTLEKALLLTNGDDIKYIIYYNLAVSYYYIGSYDMAYDYLVLAKKINEDKELHLLLAEIYLKKDDIQNAINEYTYLVEEEPENIDYAVNLANIYLNKHDYIRARKVIKHYIKLNPKEKNNQKLKSFGILNF